MPELPEVQTIVDGLTAEGVIGQSIQRGRVYWPRTIATSKPAWFCRQVKDKRIQTIRRRAKLIIFGLSHGLSLIVHLRMTGRFELLAAPAKGRPAHVHVILDLADARLLMFHDTRKFGRFYLTKDPGSITQGLGPEPLGPAFTKDAFVGMLKTRRRQIKPLLLDQTFLSGLGNIYVDEALWAAGIHPQRSAHTLRGSDAAALHHSIRKVLQQAIDNGGTSLGTGMGNYARLNKSRGHNRNELKVFRRTGQACFECGHRIERILVGQRATHLCVKCQY